MVEIEGLEPSTSSMPLKRSSQLSYIPLSSGGVYPSGLTRNEFEPKPLPLKADTYASVQLDYSKSSPYFPEASFLRCYAPTQGH